MNGVISELISELNTDNSFIKNAEDVFLRIFYEQEKEENAIKTALRAQEFILFETDDCDFWVDYLEPLVNDEFLICQHCGRKWAIPHSSRTAYSWDGEGEDPNAPINLCPYCAMEHHAYWDDMWSDYYGSRF